MASTNALDPFTEVLEHARSDIIQIKIAAQPKSYPYDLIIRVLGTNDTSHVNASLTVSEDIYYKTRASEEEWVLLHTWDVSSVVSMVPLSKFVFFTISMTYYQEYLLRFAKLLSLSLQSGSCHKFHETHRYLLSMSSNNASRTVSWHFISPQIGAIRSRLCRLNFGVDVHFNHSGLASEVLLQHCSAAILIDTVRLHR